jgi:hypothetical protein
MIRSTTACSVKKATTLIFPPQRLGDRQHHLAMRDVEKQGLPRPLAPLFPALGVAGGAKPSGLTGERQQLFTVAVRTADPSEAGARITAVEIALDNLLDDRPEKHLSDPVSNEA